MNKYPYIYCTKESWKEIKSELMKLKCEFDPVWGEYSDTFSCLVSNFGDSSSDKINIGFVSRVTPPLGLRYRTILVNDFISGIRKLIKDSKIHYPYLKIKNKEGLGVICKELENFGLLPSDRLKSKSFYITDNDCITINIVGCNIGYYSIVTEYFCIETGRLEIKDEDKFIDEAKSLIANYKRINVLTKDSINVGNVIIAHGRMFIVIPFDKSLGVIEHLGDREVMTLDNFYKKYKNYITELYDVPKSPCLTSGTILWEK